MIATRIVGLGCAAASCWPVWHGLQAVADRDYLAAALALLLAWTLARTGVELTAMAQVDAVEKEPSTGRSVSTSDPRS